MRFSGRVLVLIGPLTFSTGSSFAAATREYGVGTVIGQPTTADAMAYAGPFECHLPNSGLQVTVACSRVVAPGAREGAKAASPHHLVVQTPADTARGVDAVLEFALGLAKSR